MKKFVVHSSAITTHLTNAKSQHNNKGDQGKTLCPPTTLNIEIIK